MRYIRREKGVMVGHFANRTYEHEEEVADDHPEIVAWAEARVAAKAANIAAAQKRGEDEKALYSRVAALEKALLKKTKR